MNQLDYIKEKFLETSSVYDFFKLPDTTEETVIYYSYLAFKKSFIETNHAIKNATSLEDITDYIKQAQKTFLEHWSDMKQYPDLPFVAYMKGFYYSANLANADQWLEEHLSVYQTKKATRFFELIDKGLKFINQHIDKQDINSQEISDYAQKIIDTYQLKSVSLTKIESHKAMAFLENLDKKLQDVCQSLGVTPDVIGIHGTIGFSATPHTEAFFLPIDNTINIGGFMQDSTTILHEWIHALDYHIGNKIRANTFASEIKDSVYMDESNEYKAFQGIKQITQEIFTSSSNVITLDNIKQQILKEGTSKFFSDLLGYEFYLLSDSTKKSLTSEDAFKAVNNYLLVPYSNNNKNNVLEILYTVGISSQNIVDKLNNPTEELVSSKSFFNSVNENIWGNESLYHLGCRFSKYGLKLNNFLTKCISKIATTIKKNKVAPTVGNGEDEDYLVKPIEMLARYFEAQVFPKKTLVSNIIGILGGVQSYKFGADSSFEKNKNDIIEQVFGKDKIVKNISSIRQDYKNTDTYKKSIIPILSK